jgi:predicted ATP-grasp superfamily ATP-dependent carboligase
MAKILNRVVLRSIIQEEIKNYSAEQIVQALWGDVNRPGNTLFGKIGQTIVGMGGISNTGIKFNYEYTVKSLKKLGLADEQIVKIRDAAVSAWNIAVASYVRKYKINPKYISKMDSSFAKFSLFLNVDPKIQVETNKLARELAMKKIKELQLRGEI